MSAVRELSQKVVRYLNADIWRINIDDLPRYQALLVKIMRIGILSVRGFARDGCFLRASALTFYSLLSLVPAAAMAFGIAKGFGFERLLERKLIQDFEAQREVVLKVIAFAQSFLENTQGGLIAGIGVVVLLWTVLKVLSHIEDAFNRIWEVYQNRSLIRKFSDYLSLLFIGPVLIIMSSSLTVFITTQVTEIIYRISFLGHVSWLIFNALQLIPYGIIWALFTFVYMVMPNTQVKFTSGIAAGIAAGTMYQFAQWFYIAFQVGTAQYNAIYGSFAALPLFLIWLQISWFIVLFGAEISYACQHVADFEHEPDFSNISPHYSRVLTLLVAQRVVKNFAAGRPPLSAVDLSHSEKMPIRLVRHILYSLVASKVISRVPIDNSGDFAYQPAADIGYFSLTYVVDALEKTGVNSLPIATTPELEAISQSLQKFDETLQQSDSNRLLKDI